MNKREIETEILELQDEELQRDNEMKIIKYGLTFKLRTQYRLYLVKSNYCLGMRAHNALLTRTSERRSGAEES